MRWDWSLVLCFLPIVAAGTDGGCEPGDPPPSPTPEITPTPIPADDGRVVRIADLGYADTYIHHNDGQGWTLAPGDLMTEAGNWRAYTLTEDLSQPFGSIFTFNDGNNTWYPGGTDNNFRAANRDAWISGGLVFTYDPQGGPTPDDELTLLTLNLHTYQETNADTKLDYVVDVIAAMGIDLIAFQECAQSKDAPVVETHLGIQIRSDNMARIIVDRLKTRYGLAYQYFWDWSHYGFTDYEEGLAVVAKADYDLEDYGSKYVSSSTSVNDPLGSRKVVFGRFATPQFGSLVLLSAHISWGDAQNLQIDNTRAFLEEQLTSEVGAAFIAGDFNADAGGSGYQHMLADGTYSDAYVVANSATPDDGFDDPTTMDGTRIDYVFPNETVSSNNLEPILAQRVFLDLQGAGQNHSSMYRVSDHMGVLVRFKKK